MIQNQVYVFAWSIVVGALLALVFDFFRLLRRKGNTKNYLVYLEDVLYWILAAIIIVVSAFVTNNGQLRGYMFIGYLIGATFYLILFSNLLLKIFGGILDLLENFFGKIGGFFRKIVNKLKFKKKNVNF